MRPATLKHACKIYGLTCRVPKNVADISLQLGRLDLDRVRVLDNVHIHLNIASVHTIME